MKATKRKVASSGRQVREVAVKYRATRKRVKCRELTGEELGVLAEKMIAANDRGDKAEVQRLEKELINGFYGEVRA